MPITAIVVDRKFFSEIRNGTTFGSHTTDFTTNLAGSVMERMKLVQQIQIDWWSGAINGDSWSFIGSGHISRAQGSFIDDGFAIGDTFNYLDTFTGSVVFSATITAITDTNLYYGSISGTEPSGVNITDKYIRGTTALKSLTYKFGFIENNEATNFIDKATGKEQAYTFKDLTASTTGVTAGGVNVWETGSITCSIGSFSGTYYQTFTITHIFSQPFYAPGYEADYDPVTQPPEYAGTNSLKYVCSYEFRVVYSNPNGSKAGTDDLNLGSTAFFDENFNGLSPAYSLASIGFIDTATSDVLTGLQKEGKTRVTAIINGAFTSGDKNFGIYVAKAPATVGNLADTFNELFIKENVIGVTDASTVDGTIITNFSATTDGSGTFITVVFDVEYSTDQKARISQGDAFLIGLQVVDNTLSNALSDKVTLMGAYRPFVVNDDIEGLLVWRDNRYYNHLQLYPDSTVDGTGSYHDFKGWIEDGLLNNFNFDLDLSKNADLRGLKVELIAYNTTTEQYWVISSYIYNTAPAILVPIGAYVARQYFLQTKRDFNLPAGDQFNLIRLFSATTLKDTSFLNYDAVVSWKIDWQKWIANPNVAAAFADSTQLNNNRNQHASNYSQITAGGEFWELHFLYTASVGVPDSPGSINEIMTDYQLLSPRLVIRDYLKDGNTPPKWVPTMYTMDATGTSDLGGRILTNANTLFKVIWTYNTATYGTMGDDFSDFEAIHRIEPHYTPSSNAIEELSSIRFNLAQKLKGVSGKTSPHQTKVVVGVSTVTTTCLIDYTQLSPNQNYKLSARLFAEGIVVDHVWEDINVKWEDMITKWET